MDVRSDEVYRLHNQVGRLQAELFDKESRAQMLVIENTELRRTIARLEKEKEGYRAIIKAWKPV